MTIPGGVSGSHAHTEGNPSSIMETGYLPPIIETARITNVNVNDWTVDAVSLFGSKIFEDIQVMSPYFHFQGGEGVYVMPEVGALVWVCIPSSGKRSRPFILGFQAPFDEGTANFRAGRQSLNPGDTMIRTRDDNFIIVRRGGVVQIGATPIAQRIYVPIRNFIRDFCENYELNTLGGDLTWIVERDEHTRDGSAPVKFLIRAKEKADTPGHIAELSVGSHGEGDEATLRLVVRASDESGAGRMVSLSVSKDGSVVWELQNSWTVITQSNILFETEKGDMSFEAKDGKARFKSAKKMELISGSDILIEASNRVETKAPNQVLNGSSIKVGGPGAVIPIAKSTPVEDALSMLATNIDACCTASGIAPTSVTSLIDLLPNIPSTKATVE